LMTGQDHQHDHYQEEEIGDEFNQVFSVAVPVFEEQPSNLHDNCNRPTSCQQGVLEEQQRSQPCLDQLTASESCRIVKSSSSFAQTDAMIQRQIYCLELSEEEPQWLFLQDDHVVAYASTMVASMANDQYQRVPLISSVGEEETIIFIPTEELTLVETQCEYAILRLPASSTNTTTTEAITLLEEAYVVQVILDDEEDEEIPSNPVVVAECWYEEECGDSTTPEKGRDGNGVLKDYRNHRHTSRRDDNKKHLDQQQPPNRGETPL
jgi:hypothetical protein